ncbi:MAG TPA: Sec-independent protein translocase subunit TatA [Streptosporangiaceae bacterium]|nr:Sec-independent protein translocase subunit TatA [Streptosporangiaceae bacterium]
MGLGELSPWHLLILAAVVLVLFGAKRLPDSARSLGRAMRIFKAETSGLHGDKAEDGQPQAQAEQAQPAQGQPAAPPPQLPASAPRQDDGTLVNGVPLSEAQRTNQTG